MGRKSGGCTLPSGTILLFLVLFSVSSLCATGAHYSSGKVRTNMNTRITWQGRKLTNCVLLIQTKIKNDLTEDALTELKRYEDVDYDSFVSLMGRRDAAQPISELLVCSFSHSLNHSLMLNIHLSHYFLISQKDNCFFSINFKLNFFVFFF